MSVGVPFRFFEACFLLSIFLGPALFGAVHLWSFALLVFCLSASFLFYWAKLTLNQPGMMLRMPLDVPIGLYVLAFLVSLAFSKIPVLSLIEAFKLLGVLLAYLATLYYCWNRKHIVRLAHFLVFMGALLSLVGLLQFLGGLSREWWSKAGFLSATYVNHNHFAGLLVMLLPVALGLSVAERDKPKKVLLIFVSVVMGVAFIFALSRGALLALTVSLAFMILVLKKKQLIRSMALPFLVFLALVVCAVGVLGTGAVEQRIENTQTMNQEEELSLQYRWMTWRGTIAMIAHYPWIGAGPGTFDFTFLPFRPAGFNYRPVYAHNDFLHLMAECGFLGFSAASFLFVAFFRAGWRVIFRDDSRLRGGLGTGILAATLGLLVHGFFDFNFHIPANWLISAVLAGLLFSMDDPQMVTDARRRLAGKIGIPLLCGIAMAGAVFFGVPGYHFWEARILLKENALSMSLDPADRSVRENPWDPEAYFLRGFIRYRLAKDNPANFLKMLGLAVEDYDRAIKLNPYEPVYDLWKARALAQTLDEGLSAQLPELYRRVLKKDSRNALLHFIVAKDLLEQDKKKNSQLRQEAESIFIDAIKLDPNFAESCYEQLWEHEKNISKILSFFELTPQGLHGFVPFLEKNDLWKYHRKYHLKMLGLDTEAGKARMESMDWNDKSARLFGLNDFVGPASDPNHLDEFWHSNGELSRKIEFHSKRLRLVLSAKANPAGNTYPVLYVKIDGRVVDEFYVAGKMLKNYYAMLEAPEGAHFLSLQYVNDWEEKTFPFEDRNVWVRRVELQAPTKE